MQCRACQREISREARFCPQCGAARSDTPAILPALEGLDAERRQLSVVFCDLVGSTQIALGLDPEDWRDVVRVYQHMCAETVERFDGHVAQYLGDGVLVYFGHPVAHEDDPERAVRASLALVQGLRTVNPQIEREHGVTLRVRVGIHTGTVVVGTMGPEAQQRRLALGDTTNVASHLESLAAPDSVVVSAETARLVAGLFTLEDLGDHALKSDERPVRAYAVTGESSARGRFEASSQRGLTPLVGREHELAFLAERLDEAARGAGRCVSLVGEAGIGKSRLLHAFREQRAEDSVGWMVAGCSVHGQASAFQPFLDLLRERLALDASLADDERVARLEQALERFGLSASQAAPLLLPLFSLPVPERHAAPQLSPEAQRRLTLGAFAALLLGLAREQATAIVIEDLHWGDPSSQELVALLVDGVKDTPVLLLLTHRGDGFEPLWRGAPGHDELAITRLPDAQASRLISGVSGKPLPAELATQIGEKTGGVPLFAEELTRMVIESGQLRELSDRYELAVPAVELRVPATLEDSLRARLDRLGAAKAVAQLGAVIGREFDRDLLSRVSEADAAEIDAGLAELVDAGLAYPLTITGERFQFKHALVRDVAYGSLLRRARRGVHAIVAETLARDFSEVATRQPEVVAHHFTEAGRADEAIRYWHAASNLALQSYAAEEASAHLRTAIGLCEALDEGRARDEREATLRKALCGLLYLVRSAGASEISEELPPAREACERAGRVSDVHKISWMLSGHHATRAEYEQCCAVAGAGLEQADAALDWDDHFPVETARGGHCATSSFALLCMGRFEECRDVTDRGKAEAARGRGFELEVGLTDPGVACCGVAAWNHWFLGYPARAAADARRATELVSGDGAAHAWSQAFAHGLGGVMYLHCRQYGPAREEAEKVLALATERGMEYWLGSGMLQRTWARAATGETDAIGEYEALMGFAQQSESRIAGSVWLGALASLQLDAGRVESALQTLALADAFAKALGEGIWSAEILRLRGEALLRVSSGSEAEAESSFRSAMDTARAQSARAWELRAAASLARLLARTGRGSEARGALSPVYDTFTEGHDTPDLVEARSLLESLA